MEPWRSDLVQIGLSRKTYPLAALSPPSSGKKKRRGGTAAATRELGRHHQGARRRVPRISAAAPRSVNCASICRPSEAFVTTQRNRGPRDIGTFNDDEDKIRNRKYLLKCIFCIEISEAFQGPNRRTTKQIKTRKDQKVPEPNVVKIFKNCHTSKTKGMTTSVKAAIQAMEHMVKPPPSEGDETTITAMSPLAAVDYQTFPMLSRSLGETKAKVMVLHRTVQHENVTVSGRNNNELLDFVIGVRVKCERDGVGVVACPTTDIIFLFRGNARDSKCNMKEKGLHGKGEMDVNRFERRWLQQKMFRYGGKGGSFGKMPVAMHGHSTSIPYRMRSC
ncbi:hypothetical protein VPH35_095710 [Triticum aestivum]